MPDSPTSAINPRSSISADGSWDIYQQQALYLEEPEITEGTLLQLDATLPPTTTAEKILESIHLI